MYHGHCADNFVWSLQQSWLSCEAIQSRNVLKLQFRQLVTFSTLIWFYQNQWDSQIDKLWDCNWYFATPIIGNWFTIRNIHVVPFSPWKAIVITENASQFGELGIHCTCQLCHLIVRIYKKCDTQLSCLQSKRWTCCNASLIINVGSSTVIQFHIFSYFDLSCFCHLYALSSWWRKGFRNFV